MFSLTMWHHRVGSLFLAGPATRLKVLFTARRLRFLKIKVLFIGNLRKLLHILNRHVADYAARKPKRE